MRKELKMVRNIDRHGNEIDLTQVRLNLADYPALATVVAKIKKDTAEAMPQKEMKGELTLLSI